MDRGETEAPPAPRAERPVVPGSDCQPPGRSRQQSRDQTASTPGRSGQQSRDPTASAPGGAGSRAWFRPPAPGAERPAEPGSDRQHPGRSGQQSRVQTASHFTSGSCALLGLLPRSPLALKPVRAAIALAHHETSRKTRDQPEDTRPS
ncbi:unnamed protein product [Arctogadus glacialis]